RIIGAIHRWRPRIIRRRGVIQFTPPDRFASAVGRLVSGARAVDAAVLLLPITRVTVVAEARTPYTNQEVARYNAILDRFASDIRPAWRSEYMMADINHPIDLLPAFDWGPDVVFLLSAMVSRVTCEQASSLAIATNLCGINNVLQLVKRAGAMVVFFSTSEVYGPDCDPMDDAASTPRPNNRYGLSKLLGEQLVEYEVRTHGLGAVSLRPFMVYDEEEDLGDHRSAMIRFTSELALGRRIEVHRGSARSWLHISDAVRAIEAAASLEEYAVVNIGHPDVVPIEDLAEQIRH